MKKYQQIRLGQKDDLLKTWLEHEDTANFSRMIGLCIEYYSKTRKYIKIANLCLEKGIPDYTKSIYFRPQSQAFQYLEEMEQKGYKIGSTIKRIMKGSLSVVDNKEKEWYLELDDLEDTIALLSEAKEQVTNDFDTKDTIQKETQKHIKVLDNKKHPEESETISSSSLTSRLVHQFGFGFGD